FIVKNDFTSPTAVAFAAIELRSKTAGPRNGNSSANANPPAVHATATSATPTSLRVIIVSARLPASFLLSEPFYYNQLGLQTFLATIGTATTTVIPAAPRAKRRGSGETRSPCSFKS